RCFTRYDGYQELGIGPEIKGFIQTNLIAVKMSFENNCFHRLFYRRHSGGRQAGNLRHSSPRDQINAFGVIASLDDQTLVFRVKLPGSAFGQIPAVERDAGWLLLYENTDDVRLVLSI